MHEKTLIYDVYGKKNRIKNYSEIYSQNLNNFGKQKKKNH